MVLTHCVVRAAKCAFRVSLGAAYGGRDCVRLQNKSTIMQAIYDLLHNYSGKVELEHYLHSVYTVHSAL